MATPWPSWGWASSSAGTSAWPWPGRGRLFQPVRRRVQQAVDRRFNRRRHDAATTIQAFSGRLHQQVDLDTLTAELLALVDQTMQPTQASLWPRRGVPNFRAVTLDAMLRRLRANRLGG